MPEAAPRTSITITIGMPPQSLLPNRTGWGAGAQRRASKDKRTQRMAAAQAAWAALGRENAPYWKKARVTPTFWPGTVIGLRADPMNRIASLKAAIDGLEDAGIVENDRGVQWGEVKYGGIDEAFPHVDLLVEGMA